MKTSFEPWGLLLMNAAGFRRIALAMQGALEGAHMGHPDFRVNGRIFATLHAGGSHGMVKLPPEVQKKFMRESPAAFSPEAGAWGRRGCTRVHLASVDEETLGEAMTLAWQAISNKGLNSRAKTKAARTPPRASPARRRLPSVGSVKGRTGAARRRARMGL